jgi:hypothetical protein
MDLYPDALPAAVELPRMSVKFAFAKENEPGLELADVSTLPDDEVVIVGGVQLPGSETKLRVCYGLRRSACLRPACTYGEGERGSVGAGGRGDPWEGGIAWKDQRRKTI